MGFYSNVIMPRYIDLVMSEPILNAHRQQLLSEVSGNILEIGFGTGLNLRSAQAPRAAQAEGLWSELGSDPCKPRVEVSSTDAHLPWKGGRRLLTLLFRFSSQNYSDRSQSWYEKARSFSYRC